MNSGGERRVGIGFDVHRFGAARRLVLGGVEVPGSPGLAGHSDADVLAHAVIDALLGAAALGDIGRHFPDDDPRYEGASSTELLTTTVALLTEAGWRVVNVDSTVICERPRLAEWIPAMVERLGAAIGTDRGCVSVKATTSEGLGALGRREGIGACAVAQIERRQRR